MSRGFSLLETMVALSVFSLAALGLLSLNTQSVRISSELEARQLAQIVAGNVAVDTVTASLDAARAVETGEQMQRRRNFVWTRSIDAVPGERLYRVQIDVSEHGSKTVLARLSLLATDAGEL
ncbi:MAG TPA: type II secretion system minor pseudopilin GspI [Hyphomonas sp.]|nr:type II secretion system protein GspI [Hyphomonas sp.]HRJ02202.1 type II secretion system minor pseudopilin GspI [Hyphomonas sp.]HRK67189.1 type II secretion system minor pseudopilin GspI [Hyphomonas sp.]